MGTRRLRRGLSARRRAAHLEAFLAGFRMEVTKLAAEHPGKQLTLLAEGRAILGQWQPRGQHGTLYHLAWTEDLDELVESVGTYARPGTRRRPSTFAGGGIVLEMPRSHPRQIRLCWLERAHLSLADALVGFEEAAPPGFYPRLLALPTGLAAAAAPTALRERLSTSGPEWDETGLRGSQALLSARLRAIEAKVEAWKELSQEAKECAQGLAEEWEGDLSALLDTAAGVSA